MISAHEKPAQMLGLGGKVIEKYKIGKCASFAEMGIYCAASVR
jgi:hypothetical protein